MSNSNNAAANNPAAALAAALGTDPQQMFTPDCYLSKAGAVVPVVRIQGAFSGIALTTLQKILADPNGAFAAAMKALEMSKAPATLQRLQAAAAAKASKGKAKAAAAPAAPAAPDNSPAAMLAAEMARMGQS